MLTKRADGPQPFQSFHQSSILICARACFTSSAISFSNCDLKLAKDISTQAASSKRLSQKMPGRRVDPSSPPRSFGITLHEEFEDNPISTVDSLELIRNYTETHGEMLDFGRKMSAIFLEQEMPDNPHQGWSSSQSSTEASQGISITTSDELQSNGVVSGNRLEEISPSPTCALGQTGILILVERKYESRMSESVNKKYLYSSFVPGQSTHPLSTKSPQNCLNTVTQQNSFTLKSNPDGKPLLPTETPKPEYRKSKFIEHMNSLDHPHPQPLRPDPQISRPSCAPTHSLPKDPYCNHAPMEMKVGPGESHPTSEDDRGSALGWVLRMCCVGGGDE